MGRNIVSVNWLKSNLDRGDLIILDTSLNQTGRDNNSPIELFGIPTARPFNLREQFTDKKSEFPNTVPSESQFEQECQNLGINQDSEIIVYDNKGIYSSPRAWWLFKLMGHKNVKVLNGGLPEWIRNGYETTNTPALNENYSLGNIRCRINDVLIKSFQEVRNNIKTNEFLIIDARSRERFNGIEDEPRKNLKSGKIPNSVNIPYQTMLENGKFKSKEQIAEIFNQKVNTKNQLVFSCGSGITACIVMLASAIASRECYYLYDGSWTEYAIKNGLIKNNV